MKRFQLGLILTLLTTLTAAWAVLGLRPPEAQPEDAPAERFSALRAARHLEVIAQRPHPSGTPEHGRVARYLLDELSALGLEARAQETTSLYQRDGAPITVGRVRNVVGCLRGGQRGSALLLVSHYDTVPGSPGAADSSAGVAALLETLRALTSGTPLRNDVCVLFTDGEEPGLFGAKAFVDQDPLAKEVGAVLSFEARGTRGPVLLVETSRGNRPWIEALSTLPRPLGYSYSTEVYQRTGNTTDFSIFREAGLPGLSFAFIHGATGYHTALDSLARLDLRSVQGQGEIALGLTRRLGEVDLKPIGDHADAIFFRLGPVWIAGAAAWRWPLAILGLLGGIAVLLLARRRGRLSAGRLVRALLGELLAAFICGGALLLAAGLVFLRPYDFALGGGWSSRSLLILGLILLGLGLAVKLWGWLDRKLGADAVIGGGLLVWMLLSVWSLLRAPGASYLFILPLLLLLAVAGDRWRRPRPDGEGEDEEVSRRGAGLLLAAALLVPLLWAPTLALIAVALGPLAAGAEGLLVFLLLGGPLAPQLDLISRHGRAVALTGAALGALLIGAVTATSGYSAANPRPDSLLYALDADAGTAQWISLDGSTDAWTAQFLGEAPQRGVYPQELGAGLPTLYAGAPAEPSLAAARVEVREQTVGTEGRSLEISVSWPFEVHRVFLSLRSQEELRAITIDGQRGEHRENVGPGNALSRTQVIYTAPPAPGIRLRIEMAAGEAPLTVETLAQRFELPRLGGRELPPRPAELMPRRSWNSDSTLIRSVVSLDTVPPAPADEAAALSGDAGKP